MDKRDLENTIKDMLSEKEELLPKYQEFLTTNFPELVNELNMSPDEDMYERFGYETFSEIKSLCSDGDSKFLEKFSSLCGAYRCLRTAMNNGEWKFYSDTEELEFENRDILITDPCYVIENNRDWHRFCSNQDFNRLGIKAITRSTIYGDWSCTVWNKDTREELGEFCADAGLVSVLDYEDVKRYNTGMDEWIKGHSWCATVLRNYTGKVQIKVGYDKEWHDFYCYVEGEGSINFIGGQTGL